MTTSLNPLLTISRRHLFQQCGVGLGSIALTSLLSEGSRADDALPNLPPNPLAPKAGHHAAKAKRVIFLMMAGGPSQLDLFDHKPKLNDLSGQPIPEEFIKGKRFAFMDSFKAPKLLGVRRKFARHGKHGTWVSECLPHTASVVDELTIVRSLQTNVFNHAPAKIFLNTGAPQAGRPSMGAWVTYGIGNEAKDLPGFVVLQSGPRGPRGGSAIWSSGYLPTLYQGVPFRSGGEPILDLTSPPGVTPERQRATLDAIRDLNDARLADVGDPEIATRIASYEMAYRMQTSAPELIDVAQEDKKTLDLYGAVPGKASFANNCLLARRLVERGVRFVQLIHTDWDHHGSGGDNLTTGLDAVCKQTDQPAAALIKDLKQRGLLEDTLVVWGGEFGRTPMGEVRETVGRNHHIDAYTMWFAGGGVKRGFDLGASDDFGFAATEDKVHVHDVQATILHLLGLDHKQLTFRFQGRDFRLTDVHGEIIAKMLA